jgi:Carboxypeptidase regulatory-like domain
MTRVLVLFIVIVAPIAASAQDVAGGPRGGPGTVTLTRTDYDRLLDLGARQPGGSDQPPVPAALTRADLRVRVDGAVARSTIQLDGEVFGTGTMKVPLLRGATLLQARMAERPLPLTAEGDTHVAILRGPAPFSATLETGTPLVMSPGRGSFTLAVPPAGSVTATLDIPGDQMDVRLSRGLVLRRSSADGRTIVEATLDPGTPTQVSWTTRESAPTGAPRDVRMLADLRTLVTIGDADVRLVTLIDLNVIQGEPTEVTVQLPAGYQLASVTGPSFDRSEERGREVVLFLGTPAQRRHQFLLTLERTTAGGSFRLETSFPRIAAVQRETGEIAIEGLGALEIGSSEMPGLRRIDVRETAPAIASIARQSLLAAFRYQRTLETAPLLALDVKRFQDAPVLAAVAERAVATTLVTSEGRALTEVTLWIRNRAQPFLRVALPPDASMLSVEVAGGPAKPVDGKDGTRVPLLRPGFRPTGAYAVSFVYLHAGTPFAKKGDMQMILPKMDLPVGIVEWELFVPDRYRADRFEGSMMPAVLVEGAPVVPSGGLSVGIGSGRGSGLGDGVGGGAGGVLFAVQDGQIAGRVADASGLVIPGATITVEGAGRHQNAVTDTNGLFVVSNVPSGPVQVTTQIAGFATARRSLVFDQRPRQVDFTMQAGTVSETVNVEAEAPVIDNGATFASSTRDAVRRTLSQAEARKQVQQSQAAANEPSANVQSLQRRAAGVLPVKMEVPRAGTSHRFVKPLVIDEQVAVRFRYRRR